MPQQQQQQQQHRHMNANAFVDDMATSQNSASGHGGGGNAQQQYAGSSNNSVGDNNNNTAGQKTFLDGSFAGGWQSNNDLPDRRRVIFSILDVIRQMRPDTSRMSNKLPHMAKSLEEHLYRSARTKEEYLDSQTLKRRLQAIAQGLETHRTGSSGNIKNLMSAIGGDASNADGSQHNSSSYVSGGGNAVFGNTGQTSTNQQQNASWSGGDNDSSGRMSHNASSNNIDMMSGDGGSQHQHRSYGGMMERHSKEQNNFGALGQNEPPHQRQDSFQSFSGNQSSSNMNSSYGNDNNQDMSTVLQQGINMSMPPQQQQQQQQQFGFEDPGGDWAISSSAMLSDANISTGNSMPPPSGAAASTPSIAQDFPNTAKYQDAGFQQKQKVILQQQQRLLLLRHASKCGAGINCPTRFCAQMVTLWKHMKTCRDKHCKTSHCLSSRCVLNHYRICKSQGKTTNCEVCGPVMAKIKQQEKEDEFDPLSSVASIGDGQAEGSDMGALQSMTSYSSSLQPDSQNLEIVNTYGQSQDRGGFNQSQGGNVFQSDVWGSNGGQVQQMSAVMDQSEQSQLEQLQVQQMKLRGQLEALKQLQKQQEQLSEQQNRLQEQAQHIHDPTSQLAMQLQQQQMLLHQLQKKCQQQQMQLQQELQAQTQPAGNIYAQQQHMQSLLPTVAQPHMTGVPGQEAFNAFTQAQAMSGDASRAGMSDTSNEGTKKRRKSANDGKSKRTQKAARRGSGKGKTLRQVEGTLAETGSAQVIAGTKRSVGASPRVQKKNKAPAIQLEPIMDEPSLPPSNSKEQIDAELNTSLVPHLSKVAVDKHLESLDKRIRLEPRAITNKFMPVLQDLIDDQFGWVFHDAVDPVALGLPDYLDVVKHPMHLELVKRKLENAVYNDMETFAKDVRLTFENAILYNGEISEVGELASAMLSKFDRLNSDVIQDIHASHARLEKTGELCSLCGDQKRRFEPTILYCHGQCGMQRIQRHAAYFSDRTKVNHWCHDCFSALEPGQVLKLEDGSEMKKEELHEFKNDALPEEAWVCCDECHCWVHQVCGLFNGRTNRTEVKYTCPNCHLRRLEYHSLVEMLSMKGAEQLPHCKMSLSIEKGMHEALQTAYADRATELGKNVSAVEKAEQLYVRVVSNVEKKHLVRDNVVMHYNVSDRELPVRTKCIALFQRIHGVDTLLFALYVYEYGQDCPGPNRRRVYISYLDSVKYFEPSCYRTTVYHAILVEYLRYVKERGFHTAHIWSCPPTPGDDYIFHCHPPKQKIPQEDMLRRWYHQMLDKAKAKGIVIRTTNLFNEYFAKDTAGVPADLRILPTNLPYFEGDYIPGELETIISQLRDHGSLKPPGSDGALDDVMMRIGHNIGKMRDNFIVAHLRSRSFALAVERGEDVSQWIEDSDNELLQSKRAKISGKDSSVLYPEKQPSDKTIITNKLAEETPCESNSDAQGQLAVASSKTVLEALAESPLVKIYNGASSKADEVAPPIKLTPPEIEVESGDLSSADEEAIEPAGGLLTVFDKCAGRKHLADRSQRSSTASSANVKAQGPEEVAPEQADDRQSLVGNSQGDGGGHLLELEGGDDPLLDTSMSVAAAAAGEADGVIRTGTPKVTDDIVAQMAKQVAEMKGPPVLVASTLDEDGPVETEMFESRQQFLNFCQTNHCQFDELRRAKHSTMLVLFQLHHPLAPKFLLQCGACSRDITHGMRHHCNECSNFDLCDDCFVPVTSGLWAQKDKRYVHDGDHSFTAIDMDESNHAVDEANAAKKSKGERQEALKAHIVLLEHSALCNAALNCGLQNCQRMKKLFAHVEECDVKPKKDCRVCTRLLSLCALHARTCPKTENEHCAVLFCDRLRERNKRLHQQQQLMDDRRRRAQNELYHADEA